MADAHSSVHMVPAINPAAATTDNTAWVSAILDTANFANNELLIITGSLADADATFAVLIEEGNASNLSDNTTVAAADLLGTLATTGFLFSDDNKNFKVGYKGKKRYIRATITPAANTGNAFVCAAWMQTKPRVAPTT